MSGLRTALKKLVLVAFRKTEGFAHLKENMASATPGSRAWPKKSAVNDKKIGARLDWGNKFVEDGVEFRNLVFQPNANAENEALRKLANKSTDQKIAVLRIRLDGTDSADDFEGQWRHLVENN